MGTMTDRCAQKAIVTGGANSTRCLYWIKEFINTYLVAQGFTGRVTFAVVPPAWANDAAPADNNYLVIQPVDAWGDATKWQLVIAARNTAGASTIGGVVGSGLAIPGPGLWAAFSLSGGWNDTDKNFGAVPNTGLLNVKGAATGSANLNTSAMHLAICDRMVSGVRSGCSFLMALDDNVTATWNGGIAAGHAFWLNPSYAKPHQFFVGTPTLSNSQAWYWAYTAAAPNGRVMNAAGTAFNTAGCWMLDTPYTATQLIERDAAGWAALPLFFKDVTLGRIVGWFNGVWETDSGVADKAEDVDLNFISVGSCLFPSS